MDRQQHAVLAVYYYLSAITLCQHCLPLAPLPWPRVSTQRTHLTRVVSSNNAIVYLFNGVGKTFAGVQNAEKCFCGGGTYKVHGKVKIRECEMQCPGNATLKSCGGYLRNRVYKIGFVGKASHLTPYLIYITLISRFAPNT